MRLLLLPFLLALADGAFTTTESAAKRLHVSARLSQTRLLASPGGLEVDPAPQPPQIRKKVNEIDFCMAPSDVSLSRSYGSAAADLDTDGDPDPAPRVLSLTRALNNASNRALRRILLSRSWPSAEALNLSLRQVLASDRGMKSDVSVQEQATNESGAKCPVPRPVLNIIMRRRSEDGVSINANEKGLVTQPGENTPMPRSKRGRSDADWVADQLSAFRESYGALPGYPLADAYLECILSLATSGEESVRKSEVLADSVYDESYKRFLSVLESAGAVFEAIPESEPLRTKIAQKLVDKDICLSMMDKLSMKNEKPVSKQKKESEEDRILDKSSEEDELESVQDVGTATVGDSIDVETGGEGRGRKKMFFWMKDGGEEGSKTSSVKEKSLSEESSESESLQEEVKELKPEDLGAVLLSAEEPSMTRQLNVLSNIVQRALLFGGDQELLVLSETLEADLPAFVQRWYPSSSLSDARDEFENRPGVQYFNCLVQLLRECCSKGVVMDLDPPFPVAQSYANAYERLTAGLVELGSGYMRPTRTKALIPKTAKEEFGRFAQWESSFRKSSAGVTAYPDDLVGSYEVKDEVGGKTIGVATVVLKPEGEVKVAPPLQGLRWRLDPGPTHLDTCTFQVLDDDGTILQYRGFVDRGARLESRFSRRPIKVRGAVTFQMRDGESALMGEDYQRDLLPINYQVGTTRFVMTKAPEDAP